MKRLLIAALAGLALVGCTSGSSGDDATVKAGSGEITNPGGKPRNEQEAQLATQMQQAGGRMNQMQSQAAGAEAAAKAQTGGK